jgi:hypothetical protein
MGYQIQDVAVQLQMGTNAMMVFGQQGSQIASVFGAKGALLGAVIAVGSAIATSLAPAIFKGVDGLKAFKEAADELDSKISETSDGVLHLSKDFRKLAKTSVVAAKLEIVKSLATMGSATGKLGKEVKDLAPMFGDTFGGMDKGLHGLMESAADTAKRFKKTIKTMYGEQETSSYKKRLQEMSELYSIPIDKLDEFVSLTKKVSQGDVTGKVMKQYAESLAEAALAMNNAGKLAADDKGIESLNTASALIKSAIAASTAEEKMKLLSAALVDMDGELAKSETLLDPTPLQKYAAEATKAKASLQDMAVDGVQSLENSLLDLAKGTKSAAEAFKKMATSIIDDMARMYIKQKITGPIATGLDTMLGGMSNPFSSVAPAPAAGTIGGGVSASHLGRPLSSGSQQSVVVNYSPQVTSLDPRGAAKVLQDNAATIAGVVEATMNRRGRRGPLTA